MIWTSVEQIIMIHSKIIAKTGGLDGIRDMSGLESAFAAPMQTFDGIELFKTDLEKIARLGYGLAANHAFVDGNKRIGLYVMLSFLEMNGIRIQCTDAELVHVGLSIADGKMGYDELYRWVLEHEE